LHLEQLHLERRQRVCSQSRQARWQSQQVQSGPVQQRRQEVCCSYPQVR
jgi:hypothetical protein